MGQYNIDGAKLKDACSGLFVTLNSEFSGAFDSLAAVLVPEAGSNAYVDSVIDSCKRVQEIYNDGGYLASINAFVQQVNNAYELGMRLDQMEAEAINSTDVSIGKDSIDTDVVL